MLTLDLSGKVCEAFIGLYGDIASDYCCCRQGEVYTMIVAFPNRPAVVYRAFLASDDDGYLHFSQDNSDVFVLVPYENIDEAGYDERPGPGYVYRDYPGQGEN